MAIPPNTPRKPVPKAELEKKFDEEWDYTLKRIVPRNPSNLLASSALGLPAGARTLLCIFVDESGYDVAIAIRHTTQDGKPIGDRRYYPTGLLVQGEWWEATPS